MTNDITYRVSLQDDQAVAAIEAASSACSVALGGVLRALSGEICKRFSGMVIVIGKLRTEWPGRPFLPSKTIQPKLSTTLTLCTPGVQHTEMKGECMLTQLF